MVNLIYASRLKFSVSFYSERLIYFGCFTDNGQPHNDSLEFSSFCNTNNSRNLLVLFFLPCSSCLLFSFKNYQHCKSTTRKVFCLFVCFFLSRVIEGSNNPEWERWAYLVHSDSQSEHRISIRLILPSGAGSHMIRSVIVQLDVFLLHRATAYV